MSENSEAATLRFDKEAWDEWLAGYVTALALVDRLDPVAASFVYGMAMKDIKDHMGRFVSVEV